VDQPAQHVPGSSSENRNLLRTTQSLRCQEMRVWGIHGGNGLEPSASHLGLGGLEAAVWQVVAFWATIVAMVVSGVAYAVGRVVLLVMGEEDAARAAARRRIVELNEAFLTQGPAVEHALVLVDGVVYEVSVARREGGGSRTGRVGLVIPGNPGAPAFYDDVCVAALAASDGAVDAVVALGLVGHSLGTSAEAAQHRSEEERACFPVLEGVLDLESQLGLVVKFARALSEVTTAPRRGAGGLLVAGHSIGAWMALRVRQAMPDRVALCVLLCPTIQRMKTTASGVRMSPLLLFFRPFIVFAMSIVAWLAPLPSLRRAFARLYFHFQAPECALEGVASLLAFDIPRSAFTMAVHELGEVEEIPHDLQATIEQLGPRCVFLYAAADGWNERNEFLDIRTRFPRADVHVENDIGHAFVLHTQHGIHVGTRLGTWFADHTK
jgi:pimeloyl-ACP methyl ester carboxylesterase